MVNLKTSMQSEGLLLDTSENHRSTYTNTVNNSYNWFYAYAYTFIHSLGGFYFGYSIICINNLGKSIFQHSMHVDDEAYESIMTHQNTFFGICKLCASFLAGLLANRFGRRNLLLTVEGLNVLSIFQMLLNITPIYFYIGRAVLGFYLGFVTVQGSRMVTECYPLNKRAMTTCVFTVAISLGIFFGQSMGDIFHKQILDEYWRYFLIIPSAQSFLRACLIIIFYNHKTPAQYFLDLVRTGSTDYNQIKDSVNKVLHKFYSDSDEIRSFHENFKIELLNQEKKPNPSSICQVIKDNVCSKATRYSTLAGIFFTMFNQCDGQVFLDNYSTIVYDKILYEGAGFDVNFYCSLVVLLANFTCIVTIEFLGRKTIFLFGALCQLIFMWCQSFSIYYNYYTMTIISTVCYSFGSNFTSSIMYVYLNEIAEPFVVGLSISALWFSKTLMNEILPFTFIRSQMYWSPLSMTLLGTVMFIQIRPLYIETKGKTKTQIQREYLNQKYNQLNS